MDELQINRDGVTRKLNLVPFNLNLCVRELNLSSLCKAAAGVLNTYEAYPSEWKTKVVTTTVVSSLLKNKSLKLVGDWVKKLPSPRTTECFNALLPLKGDARACHGHIFQDEEGRGRADVPLPPQVQETARGVPGAARRFVDEVDTGGTEDQVLLQRTMGCGEGGRDMRDGEEAVRTLDNFHSRFNGFLLAGDAGKAEIVAEEAVNCKRLKGSPYYDLVQMYGELGLIDRAEKVHSRIMSD